MADALIQADEIYTFNTHHVAFFRPIKRTYVVLYWHHHVRKWLKFTDNLPNLSLHRSSTTDNGAVSINIATRPNGRSQLINVRARGYYLQSGNTRITLVEKTGALPAPFNTVDYPLVDPTAAAGLTDFALWLTQPPLAPAPALAPALAPAPPTLVHLKPIPKRIAWLIAEEASKAEMCPILAEAISPITAAVTTCFHTFDHDSINEWFVRNPTNTKCPVCREICLFTKAFD